MNNGILEEWNIGIMGKKVRVSLVVSLFHHSIIPLSQLLAAFHFSRRLSNW
jgi:hypothetical protein